MVYRRVNADTKVKAETLNFYDFQTLLRKLAEWMRTDEKWWDLVGPACCEYVKAESAMEAKMEVQVRILVCLVVIFY